MCPVRSVTYVPGLHHPRAIRPRRRYVLAGGSANHKFSPLSGLPTSRSLCEISNAMAPQVETAGAAFTSRRRQLERAGEAENRYGSFCELGCGVACAGTNRQQTVGANEK